jgi:hypothetical protein
MRIPILVVTGAEVAHFRRVANVGMIATVGCGSVLQAFQALLHTLKAVSVGEGGSERRGGVGSSTHSFFNMLPFLSYPISQGSPDLLPHLPVVDGQVQEPTLVPVGTPPFGH